MVPRLISSIQTIALGSLVIVSADWAGVTLRAAVPLAILAGCQTLTMLTGGIDLSVGAIGSMDVQHWGRGRVVRDTTKLTTLSGRT